MRVQNLGLVDYAQSFLAMREFTRHRLADTADEIWLCQHSPVFTQGLAGKPEHVLSHPGIPVVQTDRGGQVTYHGPGHIVAYPLLYLRRLGYFVKEYVFRLEEAIIRTLGEFGVTGHRVRSAPGIYVRLDAPAAHGQLLLSEADLGTSPHIGKIAALGIKISQKGCYHGLSLNVSMDLSPFTHINPCGYAGLCSVDLQSLGVHADLNDVMEILSLQLQTRLAA